VGVAGWRRVVVRVGRQATLVGCAAGLLAVAWAKPAVGQRVMDSAQFSIAFFATLLTGEAVIFALSFSASSGWPSLREIDAHIAFREWVAAGWVAAMLTAAGLLADWQVPATFGAMLFLLVNVFGVFSFVRLFGLASSGGRQRLLSRHLGRALAGAPAGQPRSGPAVGGGPVLAAYLAELDQAAARSDGNGVVDLVEQLTAAPVEPGGAAAALALHPQVIHRLAKAALVGALDPVVAASAAETLAGSVLAHADTSRRTTHPAGLSCGQAAAVLGQTSRYLAWLAGTCLVLSVRQVTTASAARELVALAVRTRARILRLVDPDPVYADGPHDLGTPLATPAAALAWVRDFTEFHGSHQAAALYAVYEILTGTKFLGNYWDGASVLTGLRDALYGPTAVDTPAADTARAAFGTPAEFDRVWTLVSAGALATLRDAHTVHPPELTHPEFTPDRQLLRAYLRTFATHQYLTTAEQAMTALVGVLGHTGRPAGLWQHIQDTPAHTGWAPLPPTTEPHHRPSACVLAIAARLAPLTPDGPDHQLRAFLARLPAPVLDATARLATRTLPDPQPPENDTSPAAGIATRLRILHQPTPAHTP